MDAKKGELIIGNFSQENDHLWLPTGPSGQLMSRVSPGARIYNQKINLPQPRKSSPLYCDSQKYPEPTVTLPQTGEVFFIDSEPIPLVEILASVLKCGDTSACSPRDFSKHVTEQSLLTTHVEYNKRNREDYKVNGDALTVINSLNERLARMGKVPYRDVCPLCPWTPTDDPFKHAPKSYDGCKHSKILKSLPTPFDLNVLSEALSSDTSPMAVEKARAAVAPAIRPTLHRQDTFLIDSVSNVDDEPQNDVDIANTNVDHLLTYQGGVGAHSSKGGLTDDCVTCVDGLGDCDSELIAEESTAKTIFDELDVQILRKVASKFAKHDDAAAKTNGGIYPVLTNEPMTKSTSIITLLDQDVCLDTLDCYKMINLSGGGYCATNLQSPGRKLASRTMQTLHTLDTRSYTRIMTGAILARERDEDFVYDVDDSVDALMGKYNRLRKMDDCEPHVKRALKHLICHKIGKERLYIKHSRMHDALTRVQQKDQSPHELVQQVLGNLNALESMASIHSNDPETTREVSKDDDKSVYTYSSLTVSSYSDVIEDIFVDIDSNPPLKETFQDVHSNVLDIYGILEVVDECNTLRGYSNVSGHYYVEMTGCKMLLYPYRDNRVIAPNDPAITISIDDGFTVVRSRKKRGGLVALKVSGLTSSLEISLPAARKRLGTHKSQEEYLFSLKASTELELSNWWIALCCRQTLGQFMLHLSQNALVPCHSNILYWLYPRRHCLFLDKLPFNMNVDHRLVTATLKVPLYHVNFASRNLTDDDMRLYMYKWNLSIEILNLERNSLKFDEIGDMFFDWVKTVRLTRLYLDGNPLSVAFFANVLINIATRTNIKFLSLRHCYIEDTFIESIKSINRTLEVGSELVIDLRCSNWSPEVAHFLGTYPLNKVKCVTRTRQLSIPEFEMSYFMDCKSMDAISQMGPLFSGRLFSPKLERTKGCMATFLHFSKKPAVPLDVYFEFRPPYLVWYIWKGWSNSAIGEVTRSNDAEKCPSGENMAPNEQQTLYVHHCEITLRNGERWLLLKGSKPKYSRLRSLKPHTILLRGYSDKSTRRWFEIISRSLAGIAYVEHVEHCLHANTGSITGATARDSNKANIPATSDLNVTTPISRHILSFCANPDATDLIMYDVIPTRKFLTAFFQRLNSQSSLRRIFFSNMRLEYHHLTFDDSLVSDLNLELLDYSFNNINLTHAKTQVFNGLAPRVKCCTYSASYNPLGDNECSARLFLSAIFDLQSRRVCLNNCNLGAKFLSIVLMALDKSLLHWNFNNLEVLELEYNRFSTDAIQKFVTVMDEKFPNLVEIHLHASVDPNMELGFVVSMESCSASEPIFGAYKRNKKVKKPKKTTRESVAKLAAQAN